MLEAHLDCILFGTIMQDQVRQSQVSTYLDENLQVNRDSRGDLAIYVRAPAWW